MKVKVTNNGTCPRGVWALGVVKVVGIGASRELDLSDDDVEQLKKIDALSVEEIEAPAADKKPKADDKK